MLRHHPGAPRSHGPRPAVLKAPASIGVIACAVLEKEVAFFRRSIPSARRVLLLEQGLHNTPDILRTRLQEAVQQVESDPSIDAIALVYGCCSRGIEGVVSRRVPMAVARAHDCITLLLGCRKRYADYLSEHPGTYWYSPGWNRCHVTPGPERHAQLLDDYTRRFGEENARYLMETEQGWMTSYTRAAFVDLGAGPVDADIAHTQRCAEWLHWEFDRQHGDPRLLQDLISGNWDDERFLVLQPGETARLTSDDRILQASPCPPPPRSDATTITIEAGGAIHRLEARASSDSGLADFLAAHGLPLNTRCAHHGLCRGCLVQLKSGRLQDKDGAILEAGPSRLDVLACHVRWMPGQQIAITVPARSLQTHRPAVVSEFKIRVPSGCEPLFACSRDRDLGGAVDVGTTTVALLIAHLESGDILARASGFNKQIRHGDNVVSRIHLCTSDPGKVGEMHRALWDGTISPLLAEAARKAGITPSRIAGIAVTGNPTMLHLAANVDPSPLGVAPFKPAFLEHRVFPARNFLVGSGLPEEAEIHLLAGIAPYVGADIAAGIVSSGMEYATTPRMLVDIGTNGEIALQGPRGLMVCATAAGPAFEGCGLTCGTRAAEGVVAQIEMTGNPLHVGMRTIGGHAPAAAPGLAGSACIDFLAQARRTGILSEKGRFEAAALTAHAPWFSRTGPGWKFHLSMEDAPSLVVTELDVAILLQAKAAIAAGIQTLLSRQGLVPGDIEKLHLAGGFGMHISVSNAIGCGLLPGFEPAQIETVGNTSLGGAYLAMLDRGIAAEMEKLRARTGNIELNLDPQFEERYIDNLRLP